MALEIAENQSSKDANVNVKTAKINPFIKLVETAGLSLPIMDGSKAKTKINCPTDITISCQSIFIFYTNFKKKH
jgi:hypothetical protein